MNSSPYINTQKVVTVEDINIAYKMKILKTWGQRVETTDQSSGCWRESRPQHTLPHMKMPSFTTHIKINDRREC